MRGSAPEDPSRTCGVMRADVEGLAYQIHVRTPWDGVHLGIGEGTGHSGPVWTASGYSRENRIEGRNVAKRWRTAGRSNPRNVR